MKLNFAAYRCPGTCGYLGPEIPPETCLKHGSDAIWGYAGRHYELIEVDPEKALIGWDHPDEQYESDLFGGTR